MLVFDNGGELTDLHWYIISPGKTFNRVKNIIIMIMTWITVILTPLSIVFEMMGSDLGDQWLWLVWFNDVSWCF